MHLEKPLDTAASYEDLVARFNQLKHKEPKDLSADQDLTLAIMNLISIEEHLGFTGAKLNQSGYYQLINEVRELRKQLMQQLVADPQGEEWCISKHLLGASYRLLEVGSKHLAKDMTAAKRFYQQAYYLYTLFWGLAMKLIPAKVAKKEANKATTLKQKLHNLVQKIINCCIE